ncbi:hypothetical protein [Microbispora sp. GKU 823]|uniref:hypothetical protein n=1 Tax=Microbispora sp. GKU 823 TaxID=1652100 RepID=UPI001C4E07A5|nr:hypothetical protein [Microbispora sp. GKU 823]
MTSVSVGSMRVSRTTPNSSSLKRKLYLAKPYPARGHRTIVIAPLTATTRTVLPSAWPIGTEPNIARKLSSVKGPTPSGSFRMLAPGLSDETTIHQIGYRKTTTASATSR